MRGDSKLVYVCEPAVINPSVVESVLRPEGYTCVLGTPNFHNANDDCQTIIIRSETVVSSDIRNYFPNLKNVVRIGTGLDKVNLTYCKENNIAVYNAAGANADAVSEYIICMMLYVLRRLHTLTKGDLLEWNRFKFTGNSMNSQVVGLVGYGNIGKLLYQKLQGFECQQVMIYDPYIQPDDFPSGAIRVDSLDDLLRKSTIVSLHIPLMKQTMNLISTDQLKLLGPETILINASRGGIVDEEAVLRTQNETQFTYIADTVVDEPRGNAELFQNNNIIVTPHIASLTVEAEEEVITLALHNFLNRQPVTNQS